MAERSKNGPYWVKAWIADLSQLTDMFRDEDGKVDYDALGREEYKFRMALARKDFSLSSRAKKVWDEALGTYKHRISAALKDKETDERESSEQRVGGNSGQGLVTAPAAPGHKATAPSTRIAPAEPEVFNLAYRGEFDNVNLTQDQYNALLQKFGNKIACDRAIDSMSAKLENGELDAKSHYATLVKWAAYRADKGDERKEATHYETVSEHNARVSAKADEWIHEHFGKKDATNG